MTAAAGAPRWQTYVRHHADDLTDHWKTRYHDGARVAVLCGAGFDPRMCLGLEMLTDAGAKPANTAIFAVTFPAPADSLAAASAKATADLFAQLTSVLSVTQLLVDGSPEIETIARAAADLVGHLDAFGEITDLVVDINALPRSVFIPLISKLLYLCDARAAEAPNLHVIAGDAAWLDAEIIVDGLDEHASWLYPYAGAFLSETDSHLPRIWIPALGEHTSLALRRIDVLVGAEDLCPLVPFPARDPRRADRLFEEHRDLLFDRLQTDPNAIIHADEANPFQVYRRLRRATEYYSTTLAPLGGCKVAYSALTSKLVAVGVLLTAYELLETQLQAGIVDIGAQQHRLQRSVSIDEARKRTDLVGLTLFGDCYL